MIKPPQLKVSKSDMQSDLKMKKIILPRIS